MKKILLAATLLLVATSIHAQRSIRQRYDGCIITLNGGTEKMESGEKGYNLALSYDQRVSKNLFLGLLIHGSTLNDDDLSYRVNLVGMDVALSWRLPLGAFYFQPRIFGGLSMVSHNTIMNTEPDIFGTYTQVTRRQYFLSPELGGRVDLGLKMGWFGFGIYAEYTKQFSSYTPTEVTNVTVTREWLTNTPFSAGVTMSVNIDKGLSQSGGNNNVPVIGASCNFGNGGVESIVEILFQRNTGLPWLRKNSVGLRGEFIGSTQYGIRFGIKNPTGDYRTSTQLGYGLFIHPSGPDALLCYRVMLWGGLGEAQTTATTQAPGTTGTFSSIQATPKADLRAELVFHIGQLEIDLGGGVGYQYIPGTTATGESSVVSSSSETPLNYEVGLGVKWGI